MTGHERTVRGAAVTWYVSPDGSRRFARLGEKVNVADDDLERFDATEGATVEPTPPAAKPVTPEPPRVGRGSSREMWALHADSLGVTYPDGATQSAIIAAVEAWHETNADDE